MSAAALLLAACATKNNNNGNNGGNSSEPQPVNPDAPAKFTGLPTSFDDANFYGFRELEKVDQDEVYEMFDSFMKDPVAMNGEQYSWEYEPANYSEEYSHYTFDLKFYENDYMEVTGSNEYKEYYLGTMMADDSYQDEYKGTAVKVGNRVVTMYESVETDNPQCYWDADSLYTDYTFRQFMLDRMEVYYIFYANVAGKYVAEDGREFLVLLNIYTSQNGNSTYGGQYFTYMEERLTQNILEIKDGKIINASYYYQYLVDHDLLTGAPVEEKVVLDKELYLYHASYGELQPSANRTSFVAMVPERGVSYASNAYVSGSYWFATMNDSDEITGMSGGNSSNKTSNVRFINPTTIQGDITVHLNNTTEDKKTALSFFLYATFSALAGTSGSSTNKSIVELLGDALGASGVVKTYGGTKYLVVGNEVKTLKFTFTLAFDDVSMEHVAISNVSVSNVSEDMYLI